MTQTPSKFAQLVSPEQLGGLHPSIPLEGFSYFKYEASSRIESPWSRPTLENGQGCLLRERERDSKDTSPTPRLVSAFSYSGGSTAVNYCHPQVVCSNIAEGGMCDGEIFNGYLYHRCHPLQV